MLLLMLTVAVFSYGISVWEIARGRTFAANADTQEPILLRNELDQLKDLINSCRQMHPRHRCSTKDVIIDLTSLESTSS